MERETEKENGDIREPYLATFPQESRAVCVSETSVTSRLRQRTELPALSSTFGIISFVTFSYTREWVKIGLLVQG